jgi:hypothetical protein
MSALFALQIQSFETSWSGKFSKESEASGQFLREKARSLGPCGEYKYGRTLEGSGPALRVDRSDYFDAFAFPGRFDFWPFAFVP